MPPGNLGYIYSELGQYDKALSQTQHAQALEASAVGYFNLAGTDLALNRLDDAQKAIKEAQDNKFEGDFLHLAMYLVAFMKRDTAEMERQVAWAAGKPGSEDLLLSFQSDTNAYHGELRKARDLSRRAVDAAVRFDSKEAAGLWQVSAALREAEFGNREATRQDVAAALALSPGRDVKLLSALALARARDASRARSLLEEVEKTYGSQTLLKVYWLPTIRAAIELDSNDPAKALMLLEAAAPYELAQPPQFQLGTMYPVYVRGEAQLTAHNGAGAAAEFQKFLDHPGVTINFPLGALAHLGLARAYALSGNDRESQNRLPGLLRLLERRRPRHPHPEGSQGGVREVAVAGKRHK